MDSSPFVTLSAELRNRIYELVLQDDNPINLILQKAGLRQDPATKRHLPISLAQTCRQVRAESIKVFYGGNAFLFEKHPAAPAGGNVSACDAFLSSIGDSNAVAIRNITVASSKVRLYTVPAPGPILLARLASRVKSRYALLLNWARKLHSLAPACRLCFPIMMEFPSSGGIFAELHLVVDGGKVLFEESRQQLSRSAGFDEYQRTRTEMQTMGYDLADDCSDLLQLVSDIELEFNKVQAELRALGDEKRWNI